MGAGTLTERMYFEQRGLDANGDRLGDWDATTRFDRAAGITYLRGGEGVMQQRLQGKQPVILTVREEAKTKALTNAWRAVDYRDSTRSFDIKSQAPAKQRGFIEILAEMHVGQDAG
jgi:hypothetical protein